MMSDLSEEQKRGLLPSSPRDPRSQHEIAYHCLATGASKALGILAALRANDLMDMDTQILKAIDALSHHLWQSHRELSHIVELIAKPEEAEDGS